MEGWGLGTHLLSLWLWQGKSYVPFHRRSASLTYGVNAQSRQTPTPDQSRTSFDCSCLLKRCPWIVMQSAHDTQKAEKSKKQSQLSTHLMEDLILSQGHWIQRNDDSKHRADRLWWHCPPRKQDRGHHLFRYIQLSCWIKLKPKFHWRWISVCGGLSGEELGCNGHAE